MFLTLELTHHWNVVAFKAYWQYLSRNDLIGKDKSYRNWSSITVPTF